MGISPSSFYAAFGDKKSLFAETIQGYMQRYTAIYIEAVRCDTAREATERILRDSVDEFTDDNRPMSCLVVSAAIQGGAETLDVRQSSKSTNGRWRRSSPNASSRTRLQAGWTPISTPRC